MFYRPTNQNLRPSDARGEVTILEDQKKKVIPNCIVPSVKHEGQSIMIWWCTERNSLGDLIKI